tara:strand:- start:403 stop:852 length:450 start_codon:yes stop_codon:yes gene_type:complete
MENENTEYKEGSGDDFTSFIFSSEPKEKNSIKLELNPCDKNIKIGLHLFQELLMIFTDGMKFISKKRNKIFNISNLTNDDIILITKYFESFGFTIIIHNFNISEYLNNIKLPNYFKDNHLIQDNTLLKDIYYEVTIDYIIYRLSFDFLK